MNLEGKDKLVLTTEDANALLEKRGFGEKDLPDDLRLNALVLDCNTAKITFRTVLRNLSETLSCHRKCYHKNCL